MTYVLTLVCTQRPALNPRLLAELADHLPGAQQPMWLDEGFAADIVFAPKAGFESGRLQDTLRSECGDAPIDIIVQPLAFRRKRLLLADMDSTMIAQECIDELADFVGKKAEVAEITERTMRGELAFEPSLRARVSLLAGLDSKVVDKVIEQRITLTPGGPQLVRTMRANGGYCALVSGGFTLFTQALGARIGFNENRANELVLEHGQLSGRVVEPILGREAKLDTLVELRAKLGLVKDEAMAVGDGANDLAMIKEAGLGIAFHAKPTVAAAAAVRIDHSDLTALLFAQGYQRDEFVE